MWCERVIYIFIIISCCVRERRDRKKHKGGEGRYKKGNEIE
jgi:hypothetical protein